MRSELRKRYLDLKRRSGLDTVPDGVMLVAVIALSLLIVLAAWRWWPNDLGVTVDVGAAKLTSKRPAPVLSAKTRQADAEVSADASETVAVHVDGAVQSPGLYTLPGGARVADAIEAAGGVTDSAETRAVNLADPLTDGTQIVVPTREEYEKGSYPQSQVGGSGSASGQAAGPVDINSADVALLDTLPGVGPSTAQKIVADRAANGPFASVADLARITGIGEKKIASLDGLIVAR